MSKFNPPSNFQFDKPNEWPEWRDRFSRYRLATKLNKDDGEVQVSALKQLPVCDIPTPIDDDFEPDAATIPTDTPVRQLVPPAGVAADPYVTRSGRTVVTPARFREN